MKIKIYHMCLIVLVLGFNLSIESSYAAKNKQAVSAGDAYIAYASELSRRIVQQDRPCDHMYDNMHSTFRKELVHNLKFMAAMQMANSKNPPPLNPPSDKNLFVNFCVKGLPKDNKVKLSDFSDKVIKEKYRKGDEAIVKSYNIDNKRTDIHMKFENGKWRILNSRVLK